MELNWLRYFHEVAQTKSVTLASQKLRVSQPAVTKMIKQLEESLGHKLFRRVGRGVAITIEGQKLFEITQSVFNRLNDIKHLSGELDYQASETIRLGASDSLCNYLLPEAITTFSNQFPNLQWSIFSGTSSDIKQRLLTGEIDYGIFYTRLTLQEKQLFNENFLAFVPFQICISPKLGRFKSVADLNRSKLTYVGARPSDYSTTIPEQWIYNQLGLKFVRTLDVNNKETQKNLVTAGAGMGIFPAFMVAAEVKAKKLTALSIPGVKLELSVVLRKNEASSLIFKTFLNAQIHPLRNQKNAFLIA